MRLNQRIGVNRDLTTKEAGDLTNMSHDFVMRRCESGELKGYRWGRNSQWRVPYAALVEFANKNGFNLERTLRSSQNDIENPKQ